MNKLLAKLTLWSYGYCLNHFEMKDSLLSTECWVCKRERRKREREAEQSLFEKQRARKDRAIATLGGNVTNV